MPDKKISQLPLFSSDVDENDLFVLVDVSAGVTKRVPFSACVFPYMIYRGQDGHRWKFIIDGTGMPVMPGEDLGV